MSRPLKLAGLGLLLFFCTAIPVSLFAIINDGLNRGIKQLRCRVVVQSANEGDQSQVVDIAITSPKHGYVIVVAIDDRSARLIRPGDPGSFLFEDVEYVIANCRREKQQRLMVIVTETVVSEHFSRLLNEEMSNWGFANLGDTDKLIVCAYFAFGKLGYRWAGIEVIE